MSRTTNNYSTYSFSFPWLLMFLVIKIGGTALASWSWWWVLLPIVPDIMWFVTKMGWTL